MKKDSNDRMGRISVVSIEGTTKQIAAGIIMTARQNDTTALQLFEDCVYKLPIPVAVRLHMELIAQGDRGLMHYVIRNNAWLDAGDKRGFCPCPLCLCVHIERFIIEEGMELKQAIVAAKKACEDYEASGTSGASTGSVAPAAGILAGDEKSIGDILANLMPKLAMLPASRYVKPEADDDDGGKAGV